MYIIRGFPRILYFSFERILTRLFIGLISHSLAEASTYIKSIFMVLAIISYNVNRNFQHLKKKEWYIPDNIYSAHGKLKKYYAEL